MSHTAHFQKLVGKRIVAIEHKDGNPFHEAFTVLFDDGAVWTIGSHAPYTLDSIIECPPPKGRLL